MVPGISDQKNAEKSNQFSFALSSASYAFKITQSPGANENMNIKHEYKDSGKRCNGFKSGPKAYESKHADLYYRQVCNEKRLKAARSILKRLTMTELDDIIVASADRQRISVCRTDSFVSIQKQEYYKRIYPAKIRENRNTGLKKPQS